MEIFQHLFQGFVTALTLQNLYYAALGVLVGQVVGILPGLGPVTGIALLVPVTFGMDPTSALILLAGVYYGAMFGGAITSILINTPGDAAAVVTTFDGYPLARKGEAGRALGVAAVSSFVGGTASVVAITLVAPLVANVALAFGPVEYTVLLVAAMATVAGLASGSTLKSAISAVLGLILATVGQDAISGIPRFIFGRYELLQGIDFITVAIGLFAVAEILVNLQERVRHTNVQPEPVKGVLITAQDAREISRPVAQGSLVGFLVGLLPGAGATIATFLSYALAKRLSRRPKLFGQGSIEGVAASESANNASVGGALVPMLTLGVPGSNSTAVLLGAMLILGLEPGPLFFNRHPEIAWGVIASMYIGNVLLLILNIPMIRVFTQVLRLPYSVVSVVVLVLAVLGAYSLNNNLFEVFLMLFFGAIGFVMKKQGFPVAPLVLTLVLGKLLERNWRRSLIMSQGSWGIFLDSPIAVGILVVLGVTLIAPFAWRLLKDRVPMFQDEARVDESA